MAIGGSADRFGGYGRVPPLKGGHGLKEDPLSQWKLSVISDVGVKYLQLQLISQQLLSWHDWEEVQHATRKPQDSARMVLDLIEKQGRHGFEQFAAVLQADYEWLADDLKDILQDPKNEQYFQELDIAHKPSFEVPDSMLMRDAEFDWKSRIHGAPVLPTILITRPVVAQIRQTLCNMKQKEVLALYAMSGAGKSTVAQDVIHDEDFVRQMFPGGIFWVNVGRVDKDVLLAKMQAVYERMIDGDDNRQPFPMSIESGKYRLQKLVESKIEPVLLVLDDVWSSRSLDAFDIGCRVLLTCRDSSVTRKLGQRAHLEQIKPGFEQEESLELLRKMTGAESIDDLPREAAEIHMAARGVPMVISLMGGILAGNQRPNKWSIYLEKYKKGQMDDLKMDSSEQSICDAVALSYEALDEKVQEKYRALAVFANDAVFSSEALCALWSSSTSTDQSGSSFGCYGIMGEFEDPVDTDILADVLVKKSLLNSFFERDTYMYFLHDLQRRFLQRKIGPSERVELHRKLLEWYFQKEQIGGGLQNRLNDQYFLWNVGHHLLQSERLSWFSQLYLDLDFVRQKIAVTGPSDLLNDYQKYKDYIDMGGSGQVDFINKQTREDFENFVRIHSHQLLQKEVDILQLGLSMPETSAVFVKARVAVAKKKSKLYFECCNDRNQGNLLMTKLHTNAVTCCIFLPSLDCVITGDSAGSIHVWDSNSGTEILYLQASEVGTQVTSIQLIEVKSMPDSPVTPPPYFQTRDRHHSNVFIIFVSTATDGIARVWQVIYDASTAADAAASANKRRSRHLSAGQSSSFPGTPGTPHHDNQGRPVSWAPDTSKDQQMSKSRAGSVSSKSSSLLTTPSASNYSLNQVGVAHVADGSSHCKCIAEFRAHRTHIPTNTHQRRPSQPADVTLLTSAVHPNKNFVATGDSIGTLRVWRADTAREEAVLAAGKFGMDGSTKITACSFSLETNSRIIAAGNEHAVIRLWNFQERELLYTFKSHRLAIVGLHFVNEAEIVSVSQTSIIQWNFKQALKKVSRSEVEERRQIEALVDVETDATPVGMNQLPHQRKNQRIVDIRRTSSVRLQNIRGSLARTSRAERRLTQTAVLFGAGSLVDPGGMEYMLPTKSICLNSDLSPCGKYLVVGTERKGLALWEVGKQKCCGFQRPHVERVDVVSFGRPTNFCLRKQTQNNHDLLLLSGSKATTILHDAKKMIGDSLAFSTNFEAAWYDKNEENPNQNGNFTMTILDWESKAHFFHADQNTELAEDVFKLDSKKVEIRFPGEDKPMKVTSMAIAGRGQVVLGTAEGQVFLALEGGKVEELSSLKHAGPALCLAVDQLAENELRVASGSVGYVHVLGKKSPKIKLPDGTVHALKFIHPQPHLSELLVGIFKSAAGHDAQPAVEFLVYQPEDGHLLRKIGPFSTYMMALGSESTAWSRSYFSFGNYELNDSSRVLFDCSCSSDRFAICTEPRLVRLSSWSTGEQLQQLRLKSMWNEARDGLAVANQSKATGILDPTEDKNMMPSTSSGGRPTNVTLDLAVSAFVSNSLRKLSVSNSNQLRLTALKFSPSGLLLATGDSGGSVRVWSTTNFRPLCCLQARSFDPVYDISLSTCDRLLVAVGGANKIAWWSLDQVDPSLLKSASSLTPTSPSSDTDDFLQRFKKQHEVPSGGKKKDSGPRPKYTVRQGSFETDEDDDEHLGHDPVDAAVSAKLRFGLTESTRPKFSLGVDEEATPTPSPANSLEIAQQDLAKIIASLKEIDGNPVPEPQRNRRQGQHSLPVTSNRQQLQKHEKKPSVSSERCDSCRSILHAKRGRKKNPSLLQVFQVSNGPVRRVVASPHFDEFVTVDDAGSVYLLKAIGSKP